MVKITRHGRAALIALAWIVASACTSAPPAPPAQPPAPAEAAKPAAATPPAAAAQPTQAAKPAAPDEAAKPAAPVDAAKPATAAPAAQTKSGSQVVISQATDASTLDPAGNTQVLTMNLFWNLYDCLTTFDSNLQVAPALATSWTLLNDTTWQFKLRPGVKFHNGEPFDANAVKYTYERISKPGKHAVAGGFATIDAINVVDPQTVNIVTKKPDPLLPKRAAAPGCQIIPPEYAAGEAGIEKLASRPVGTGAYKFVEWKKDEQIVLEANRDWWGGAPSIEKVIFRATPDDFARIAALTTGEADVITNVPPDQIPTIKSSGKADVVAISGNQTDTFLMNGSQGPFADNRVRLALNYAVDREKLVKEVFLGYRTALGSLIPSVNFGYDPTTKPFPFDPTRARALLAEAGQSGLKVTFIHNDGVLVNARQVVQAVAEMYRQVGIESEIQAVDAAARFQVLTGKRLTGTQLMMASPTSTTFDPDGDIWRLMHPDGLMGPYFPPNQPGQRFHDLMEEARYSLDQQKRLQNYQEVDKFLRDNPPVVYLFEEQITYGASDRVTFTPRNDNRIIVSTMSVK